MLTCVLVSGGMDSAACVHYYLDLHREVRALFVDYRQAARRLEVESARAVASHYGITLDELSVTGPRAFQEGEIAARNALLAMAAAMHFPERSGMIALGIHTGTTYYDCTPEFVEVVNTILDGYTDGRLQCEAPFVSWSKADIWQYCRAVGVPIDLTYSCEAGSDPPCGRCLSCLDRRGLDAREE
jgi:7-cyano-7-deazaguanine synthase